MKTIIAIFPIIGLLLSISFATDHVHTMTYKIHPISSVEGPSFAATDELVHFDISFYVTNGCGKWNQFLESTTQDTLTIEVEAVYPVGRFCTMNAPKRIARYTFQSSNPGTFYFKFKSGPNKYITHILTVE